MVDHSSQLGDQYSILIENAGICTVKLISVLDMRLTFPGTAALLAFPRRKLLEKLGDHLVDPQLLLLRRGICLDGSGRRSLPDQ
jgi:hypothetical protein